MFEALGRVMYRRRLVVVALALVALVGAGVWGTGVFGRLGSGGFEDPGSESYRAGQLAAAKLGSSSPDVIALYSSKTLTVDDPAFRSAVTGTLQGLPHGDVGAVASYWSTHAEGFVSRDRHATYAVVTLPKSSADRDAILDRLPSELKAPGLTTQLGGPSVINRDINERVSADIGRAESISMPVLLVLLVIIFGSLAAASLPLAIGGAAILGAFTALRALSYATDVSVFAVNIVTIMGLGLAIDYGLFVVSRFREEVRKQPTVEDAVARTMATAGRTVAVSGVTVAVSLAGLLIFSQGFLRSMGFGGISAVVIAMISALTVLPALLGLLGRRVDALSVRPLFRRMFRRPPPDPAAQGGAWARIAHSVMRRPIVYAVAVVAVLVALGLPFLRVQFGGIDVRVLPAGTESRVVSETIDADFPAGPETPITAIVDLPAPLSSPSGGATLQTYLDSVAKVPSVTGTTVTGVNFDVVRVAIGYDGDPVSKQARAVVADVRAIDPPSGTHVLVGGQSAALADLLDSIGSRLPWMALMVVATTFVLLFLAFGSVVLPLKAVLMNVLSLGASFGAVVWIFQEGHLSGLLNFTATGFIEATQPILVLAIVFGLSMDYEVFLMSRIREQYDLTGDNTTAVASGLQRTGGIITSAALLLLVVISAFSASGITFIKLIGVAMLIAVVVDATIVRTLLVPATMRLLGNANWWAPAPLRRLYARYGIRESDGPDELPAPEPVMAGAH